MQDVQRMAKRSQYMEIFYDAIKVGLSALWDYHIVYRQAQRNADKCDLFEGKSFKVCN